jgi:hypothetical protein
VPDASRPWRCSPRCRQSIFLQTIDGLFLAGALHLLLGAGEDGGQHLGPRRRQFLRCGLQRGGELVVPGAHRRDRLFLLRHLLPEYGVLAFQTARASEDRPVATTADFPEADEPERQLQDFEGLLSVRHR